MKVRDVCNFMNQGSHRAPGDPVIIRRGLHKPQSDSLPGGGYCRGVDFKYFQGAHFSAGLLTQICCSWALTFLAPVCICCFLLWAVSCLSMMVAPCSRSGPFCSVQLISHLVRSFFMPTLGQVKVGNYDD